MYPIRAVVTFYKGFDLTRFLLRVGKEDAGGLSYKWDLKSYHTLLSNTSIY